MPEDNLDFKAVFDKTYPPGSPMPFQGAWPIDLWKLEATISEHPELWWPEEVYCACGEEIYCSYKGKFYCKKCFATVLEPMS